MCAAAAMRRWAPALVLAMMTLIAPASGALGKAPRPPLCDDGRFVVDGAPLLPDPGSSGVDAVVVARPDIAVASGCSRTQGQVRRTRKGTLLKAKWRSCAHVAGTVTVGALIGPGCDTLSGKIRARKARINRRFTATRGRCGDARLDRGAPEECEASSDCSGGRQCGSCQCVTVLPGPTRGSAVAVSPDESRAVVVNRDAGSVTVLALDHPAAQPSTATKMTELDLGAGSEPWQAAVAPDGASAYVILRREQKLVRIEDLAGTPRRGPDVAVGSEPTGLALTPTGASAWVANWGDGTLSEVATGTMRVVATLDLNAARIRSVETGITAPRPALAHPRAIAITNDGDADDGDERLYVTDYFAFHPADFNDVGSGILYVVPLATRTPAVVFLHGTLNFTDENGGHPNCFANQLHAITINGPKAYVLSVCASPRGAIGPHVAGTACTTVSDCSLVDPACTPVVSGGADVCVDNASVKTVTAPLLSVVDLAANEATYATASLNASFRDMYVATHTPDDASRRYPLFANDIAFVPGSSVAYVTANGVDAVFRIAYDSASGLITSVGSSLGPFIDLAPSGVPAAAAGRGPIGLAITDGGKFALVANDLTRNASFIDLTTQTLAGGAANPKVVATTAAPAPGSLAERVLRGKRFFDTGLGRWSLRGQGWGACQVCHPDGLTDNVTWFFDRGPRQATSLDGSFASHDPTDQRIFSWTAVFDEVADFELNTRGVSGGVGAIVSTLSSPPADADRIDLADVEGADHAGLNGSATAVADPANPLGLAAPGLLADWDDIKAFMQQIRSPRAPTTLDRAAVATGRALFMDANCQGCHGGAKWTISRLFYSPSASTNAALKTTSWSASAPAAGFSAALFPALTPANQVMRLGDAANDQLTCILRPVGTFFGGLRPQETMEVRSNMATVAQGNGDQNGDGRGYNPPSLLDVAAGAPYLHAGNVAALEGLFSGPFAAHYQALAPNFLADSDPAVRAAKVNALVAFLLSIDEDTPVIAIPPLGPAGGDFCAP